MTQAQKIKVIEVIKGDANLQRRYYQMGQTCVIGGLLLKAGWTPQALEAMSASSIEDAALGDARDALLREYGLRQAQCYWLQCVNDETGVTERRRELLIDYVNQLEVENVPA